MSNEKNAFSDLAEFYNSRVEEADAKGFAERYRAAAEKVTKDLEQEGFHIDSHEYLDGYFLFGKGTNSIFHFTVKECPGWSFGIWWEEPTDDVHGVMGEWFAQFTETIDKFKPSASVIAGRVHISDKYGLDYDLLNNVKFIRDEPDLAFCRDYFCWDLNTEYHSREEAQKRYKLYVTQRDLKAKCQAEYDQACYNEMLKTIKINLEPDEQLYLCDGGEFVFPRYHFVIYSPTADECHGIHLTLLGNNGAECDEMLQKIENEIRNRDDVHLDTWTYDRYIQIVNYDPTSRYPECKKID